MVCRRQVSVFLSSDVCVSGGPNIVCRVEHVTDSSMVIVVGERYEVTLVAKRSGNCATFVQAVQPR